MAVPEEEDDGEGEEMLEEDDDERDIRTAGAGGFMICVCRVFNDVYIC